jgi:hypothetical protein
LVLNVDTEAVAVEVHTDGEGPTGRAELLWQIALVASSDRQVCASPANGEPFSRQARNRRALLTWPGVAVKVRDQAGGDGDAPVTTGSGV